MSADLTSQTIKDTYKSLLHLNSYSSGLTSSLETVYDGDGTASPLSISTGQVKIDNFTFDGQTITFDTGAYTLTFPSVGPPGNDYVLLSDSSGVLSWAAQSSGGAGLVDGDYGDITVSGTGTVMTIDNDAVTYAKIQNVSATDKILGRSTVGAGDIEEITCTAAGRALLDDATTAAQRTTLSAAASGANTDITSVYLNNTGLKIKDTGGDHGLSIVPGTDLSADRVLTVTTGDAARTITLSGNPTLSDWFDQSVKAAATPTFAGANVSSGTLTAGVLAGTLDAGGATSLEIPNGTSMTTNAAGEIALDTNGDGSTITTGVIQVYDGTQNTYVVSATNFPSSDNDVPAYDSATNSVVWQAQSGAGGSGLSNVVEDLTPQLGGDLDANTFDILFDDATGIRDESDNEQLIFQTTASAVNYIEIQNADTTNAPVIRAVGDDANVSLNFEVKGTGQYGFRGTSSGPATLRFYEDTDNGNNYTAISAAASITSTRVLTLPTETGTIYASGNTDVALADGGTGASLTDPNADNILFWDDSAGAVTWLTIGNGLAITGTSIATSVAAQSDMETATSTTLAVTPGRTQYHPGVAKFWIKAKGDGTVNHASYNVNSLTDSAAGRITINILTDFSTADYVVQSTLCTSNAGSVVGLTWAKSTTQAAGVIEVQSATVAGTLADPVESYFVVGFGDQ